MSGLEPPRQQPLVLIIEDRPVMRAMLREFVQNAFPDIEIVDAATGARALELCARLKPTLILMDVCLPDANGIELTARVKAETPAVSVIVVSTLSGPIYVEKALAAGAVDYVAKDRLLADLIPAMARVLTPDPLHDGRGG